MGLCALILSSALAIIGLWSVPRQADAATTETKRFTAFETAWRGANPTALVGCMDAKGKISVLLLEKPFAGRAGGYDKDRAGKSLKRYFDGIIEPKLKDVTPDKQRKSNPSVRIYDYTYRPKKGNQLTTRLEVRLKQVGTHWVLNSLSERRKS